MSNTVNPDANFGTIPKGRWVYDVCIKDGFWGSVITKTMIYMYQYMYTREDIAKFGCVPQHTRIAGSNCIFDRLPQPRYCHTDSQFITRLKLLTMFFDNRRDDESDNFEDYNLTQHYTVTIREFRGNSCCRCCGTYNGTREYYIHNHESETSFVFPEGFIHYIEQHNVHPDEQTMRFIMNMPLDIFVQIMTKLKIKYISKVKNEKKDHAFSFKDALLKKPDSNVYCEKQIVTAEKKQTLPIIHGIVFDFNDGLCEMMEQI